MDVIKKVIWESIEVEILKTTPEADCKDLLKTLKAVFDAGYKAGKMELVNTEKLNKAIGGIFK